MEMMTKKVRSLNAIKMTFLFLDLFTTVVMASILYIWYIALMPGLKQLRDNQFIMVMKALDKPIQNGYLFFFFGIALGTLLKEAFKACKSQTINNPLLSHDRTNLIVLNAS